MVQLNKLFKPLLAPFSKEKWRSKNPEVRKKAVQELPVSDQQTLSDIAMNDSEESIRALAAGKLSDLDLLQTIIMKGTNGTVKEAAQNRMFQLICGLKHPVPDFAVREKMVRGSRNSALLEFVAANANEAALREITIKKISRDPLLGDIALLDDNPSIRQLAAQQIAKRSTLERVTKKSRRKDKRVYKIVKSKLDRIVEDEERPALLAAEVIEICVRLEKLHKRNRLLQEKTTFENDVARWNEIKNFSDPQTTERFQCICDSINNSIEALETEQRKEQDAIQNLETLLSSLSSAVDDLLNARESAQSEQTSESAQEVIKNAETIIQNLGREWHEQINCLTQDNLISSYNSKFQSVLDLADAAAEPVHEHSEKDSNNSHDKLKSLTEQAENMLDKAGFILEKSISALQHKFQQVMTGSFTNSNEQPDNIKQLKQQFQSAMDTLKERLNIQQQKAEKFKQKIEAQSEKIKTLINDGHVSRAEKLLKEQLKDIEKSELIANIEKQNLHNELHKIHSQLDDLSSWRNWAHDHERENLAIKAEQLAEQIAASEDLEKEYSDITAQIKDFRQQWKAMRSRTQEDIWQRFNNACNLAYEQCIPYIEKQNEQRQKNLEAKQAICEQIEKYIASMGWPTADDTEVDPSIDWIQVDKITRQARKEWSAIGFVERKHHKAINQRFDQAIEIIRAELKKVWQINQDKFFDLIQKVEALQDIVEDDLSGAINKAKNYQRDWRQIGPVSAYQRNKLWKRFRKGCDLVFNKRQENIEQKNQVNSEHLREKEAICENLEALNLQPLKLSDLENAFADIEKLWQELKPQAKSLSKDVNQRYALAVAAYQDKIDALLAEQQQQQLQQLIHQAEFCTQVEASDDDSSAAIEQIDADWQALNNNRSDSSPLTQRYQQAVAAINTDKEALIENEVEDKKHFCLKYEILTGKETPADEQQARMKMQVELLNSNMGQNRTEDDDSKAASDYELQIKWYEMSNFSQDKALEERFKRLLDS